MAFKEKTMKQILAMPESEQEQYWKDFKNYLTEQKKEARKKIAEKEQKENQKNKKKMNHARFVLFGEMIKHEGIKDFIQKMSKNNSFSEKDKADINILMDYLKWDIRF